ncbi:putative lipoprotein [Chloroherpeton thalassium ATCC 35110]|uniref:Putative lipoprotein n=1 Tax=Chloroherpeton thalassium (strain ATCC 35110 / GB-78) TaxID=517418 RepID=B3QYZ4_CHLT3|nr:outer membrane protein assembly factor BamD [Chloroherpeton thalassium]ACF13687.1 putative lipoprotein [Chloroherpeton thalassium ATCC 35110]
MITEKQLFADLIQKQAVQKFSWIFIFGAILGFFSLTACSSVAPPVSEAPADQFDYAKRLYEAEDYQDAIMELQRISYNIRATELEDDVMFYLAQSYYKSEQYLLAVDTFKRLVRNTPGTKFARVVYFQIAMCYYNLSMPYQFDQQYTQLTIQQFQIYIDGYPAADSASIAAQIAELNNYADREKDNPEYQKLLGKLKAQYGLYDTLRIAEEKIRESREKLARKTFESAEQYIQLRAYKSAEVYFDEVILGYSDSPYYEKALLGKIDVQMTRKKWSDVLDTIEKYKARFPEKTEEVEDAFETAQRELSLSVNLNTPPAGR